MAVPLHTRLEKAHKPQGKSLRDVIFGANDGFVSSLALVAGMSGAFTSDRVVLVAGLAGAVAGGISMALGAYLAVKSEVEYYQGELEREQREVEMVPHREREEIREIYLQKGFTGEELEKVVETITADKKRWINVMMEEELQLLPPDQSSPFRAGLLTGGAFLGAALVPLFPFFFGLPVLTALVISILLTAVGKFAVGASKTLVTGKNWIKSGIEMVGIGLLAAGVSYLIGTLFSG